MAVIDLDRAKQIIAKLEAKKFRPRKNRPHELYGVYLGKTLITRIGLRRGSRKSTGHDHIPSALFVQMRQALDLAQCPMSREEWLDVVRSKGKLPKDT